MIIMPETRGKWETFTLSPVSKTVKVHIAFDGPVTDEGIKKAIRILELGLDWAPPEEQKRVLPPSIPSENTGSDEARAATDGGSALQHQSAAGGNEDSIAQPPLLPAIGGTGEGEQ